MEVGLSIGGVTLPDDGSLETLVASVLGVNDEVSAADANTDILPRIGGRCHCYF